MQEKIIIMEDGEFREYDLVEICYSKEYNKSYVIYKDKDVAETFIKAYGESLNE